MKSFDASEGSPTKKYVVMVDFHADCAPLGAGLGVATVELVTGVGVLDAVPIGVEVETEMGGVMVGEFLSTKKNAAPAKSAPNSIPAITCVDMRGIIPHSLYE